MKVSLPLAEPEVLCTESGHFAASLVEVDHTDNGSIAWVTVNRRYRCCFSKLMFYLDHN